MWERNRTGITAGAFIAGAIADVVLVLSKRLKDPVDSVTG